MKNNILNDLVEYKKSLEEKFGFNNINIPKDDYHTDLNAVENGINLYFRERLGNLVLEKNSIIEHGDKIIYKYTDYGTLSKKRYIVKFNKNDSTFLLEPYELGMYISSGNCDIHFLYANLSEIIYLRINENQEYFLLENLKFGSKVDVAEMTSKYYDKSILRMVNKYEYLKELSKEIINGKSNIVPEIEFISKIYEDTIRVSASRHANCMTYRFTKDELIIINGVFQDVKGFGKDKSPYFHEREGIDLMVCWHLGTLNDNVDLLSRNLNLDEKFQIDENSLIKKLRRF